MRTFKDYKTFEKKLNKSLCWNDYFKINGKQFKIYEYGGGSMFHMSYDYVYFYNKRSKTMLYIKYNCPSYQFKEDLGKDILLSGKKINIKDYSFISFEVLENPMLWREDTL